MYQVKTARSYRGGNTGIRSYVSSMGIQDRYRILTDDDMTEMIEAMHLIGVRASSEVVAEKVIVLGSSLESNPRAKSKFARILDTMRGKRKKNSSDKGDTAAIGKMSSEFHGREPIDEIDVVEQIEYEDRLAILADLLELGILSSDGTRIITLNFNKPHPKLTCDSEGKELQLIGGDQNLDLDPDDYDGKEIIPIGHCVSIAYETDKHHLEDSNGTVEAYEHYFGEEFYRERGYSGKKFFDRALRDGIVSDARDDGFLPIVLYDSRNEKIMLIGGRYKVEDVGIKN